MPDLIDMHVHIRNKIDLKLLLANGITKDVAVCSFVTSFMTNNCMESHIKTSEKHRKKVLPLKQ